MFRSLSGKVCFESEGGASYKLTNNHRCFGGLRADEETGSSRVGLREGLKLLDGGIKEMRG